MPWTALILNLVAFACFIMSARIEWGRIKPRYDPSVRRVLPGGKWVLRFGREFYSSHGRWRYNLAVIAQWVSLAIFVCTLFQVRR